MFGGGVEIGIEGNDMGYVIREEPTEYAAAGIDADTDSDPEWRGSRIWTMSS